MECRAALLGTLASTSGVKASRPGRWWLWDRLTASQEVLPGVGVAVAMAVARSYRERLNERAAIKIMGLLSTPACMNELWRAAQQQASGEHCKYSKH
jgi:hypothetical protein